MYLQVNKSVCLLNLKYLDVTTHHCIGVQTGSTTLDDTLKLLHCVPSLEVLYLELPMSGIQDTEGLDVILHILTLQELGLFFLDNTDLLLSQSQVQAILLHLEFPSLTHLVITFIEEGFTEHLLGVAEMLRRSDAKVEVFHLNTMGFTIPLEFDTIVLLLEAMPVLQEFIDRASDSYSLLLRLLEVNTGETILLPNLRMLGLYKTEDGIDFDRLEKCLLSRSPPDDRDYPYQRYDPDSERTHNSDESECRSSSGVSILSNLKIRNQCRRYSVCIDDLLKSTVIADMHASRLIINIDGPSLYIL